MKILKENATREEAIIHAVKHLGQKVVKDKWEALVWFDESGIIFEGGCCNSHAFSLPNRYTLYDPTPEPDPAEIPEAIALFFAESSPTPHMMDFGTLTKLVLAEARRIAREEIAAEKSPAEIPDEVVEEMKSADNESTNFRGSVIAMLRVYHRWAVKRGAA